MPKKVDHDLRRVEIIDAARTLVLDHGARALTLRRVAEHMGMAHGALRTYFATKCELIDELVRDAQRRIGVDLQAQGYPTQRGLGALRTLYRVVLPTGDHGVTDLQVPWAVQAELMEAPDLAQLRPLVTDRLRTATLAHVREAIADEEITGRQPAEVTALLLLTFAMGLAAHRLHSDAALLDDLGVGAAEGFEALLASA